MCESLQVEIQGFILEIAHRDQLEKILGCLVCSSASAASCPQAAEKLQGLSSFP